MKAWLAGPATRAEVIGWVMSVPAAVPVWCVKLGLVLATCMAIQGSVRAAQVDDPEERLIEAFHQSYASKSVADRRQAVMVLAESSRSSPALESSKKVTAALASALRDPDDVVARDALDALRADRDAPTASAETSSYLAALSTRITIIVHASGMDWEKNLSDMEKANRNGVAACEVIAHYLLPDGQEALARALVTLEEVAPGRGAFFECEEAIVDALLQYATRDAFAAIVAHLRTYDTLSSKRWLLRIDEKLRAFSSKQGLPIPPLDTEDSVFKLTKAWQTWFIRNAGKLRQDCRRPTASK